MYRQQYCLDFQIIRSVGKNYDLFTERDAYCNTTKYSSEIERLIRLYNEETGEGKGRLGARLEHRMTAETAKDILDNCTWRVGIHRVFFYDKLTHDRLRDTPWQTMTLLYGSRRRHGASSSSLDYEHWISFWIA